MKNKKYIYSFIALATFLTLASAVPVLADDDKSSNQSSNGVGSSFGGGRMFNRGNNNRGMMRGGLYGTVTAVNGNTITMTVKRGSDANAVTTTYTVDATNAKITKNNIAGTISSILVGDKIIVKGTLTGTNLVATKIRDGVFNKNVSNDDDSKDIKNLPVSLITGNGQPIVAGTVSSISGSTLTITNKSNVTYTVNATNAKIVQGQTTIAISNIAVGDMVIVQGAINGNSVVATSVIDQTKPTATNTTTTQFHRGFFGNVGSFFARIFGF